MKEDIENIPEQTNNTPLRQEEAEKGKSEVDDVVHDEDIPTVVIDTTAQQQAEEELVK